MVPALWPLRGGRLVCAWALLLVALTRSCAAGPDRWQCGRPAWATTCGVNLRSEGAQAATCPADGATPGANEATPELSTSVAAPGTDNRPTRDVL